MAARDGQKLVSGWVTVEKWKTLRHMVTDQERSQADLLSEAIDMLAEKYAARPAPRRKVARHDREP